jgi:hypothetical protein
MNELVWPAVIAFVAVLTFLRLRPARAVVSPKKHRALARRVTQLEKANDELLAEMEKRAKTYLDDTALMKKQASELLNAMAADVTELKAAFSSVRTKAGLRAVVEASRGGAPE